MPTARWRHVHTLRGGDRGRRRAGRARRRDQGRRARRRQGRDRGRRPRAGARRAARDLRRGPLRRRTTPPPERRGRGAPAAGSCRCSRCATASARYRWRRRATTSASATATRGPNTGGMGSYSPVLGLSTRLRGSALALSCTSRSSIWMRARGTPFHGVLYAGLMLTADRARGCSSSTSASAIPRRRRCCRGCARTCSSCCSRAARPGGLIGEDPEEASRVVAASGRSRSCWRAPATPRPPPAAIGSQGSTASRTTSRSRTPEPPGPDGTIVTAGGRVLNVTGARRRRRRRPASRRMLRPG